VDVRDHAGLDRGKATPETRYRAPEPRGGCKIFNGRSTRSSADANGAAHLRSIAISATTFRTSGPDVGKASFASAVSLQVTSALVEGRHQGAPGNVQRLPDAGWIHTIEVSTHREVRSSWPTSAAVLAITRLLAVDLLLEDIELRARPTTGPEKSAIDDVDGVSPSMAELTNLLSVCQRLSRSLLMPANSRRLAAAKRSFPVDI
jgi:hypothetical protein